MHREGEGVTPLAGYLEVKKYPLRGGKPPVENEVANNMANKEVYNDEQ